jgi:hypothetical protein
MSNLATITNNILADSGIDDINVIVSTGSYANPAWITSLAWTKITGAPSGIVTGTGTTNYLPKFTGSTTIGNSAIHNSTSFVAINNTAGGVYALDIFSSNSAYNTRLYQPSSDTSTYTSLIIQGAMTSVSAYFGIGGSTTGNTSFRDSVVIGSQSSHPLVFNTADAERMEIFTDGNVSISNSPSNAGFKLDVNGTGRFSAASTDYALTLQNIQDDSQGLLVRATDNDGSLYLIRAQSSNSSTSQTWVDRFTLAKNGAATFSSSVTATNALFNSTSTQLILQNTDGGTNAERIGMFMTGGDTFKILSLNDNNTTRVDNIIVANVLSGNVGIGTASPNANSRLHVYRAGGSYDTIIADGDAGTNTGFAIYEGGSPRYALYSNGAGGNDSFNIYNFGAATNSLTISTTGAATFGSSVTVGTDVTLNSGTLFVSAGSGQAYSSRLLTAYIFPYITTYLDSFAGPSWEGRLQFRTNSSNGAMNTQLTILNSGAATFSGLAGSGNRIVVANSGGTLISAVIGSGLAFDGTTLTATGGGSGSISGSGTSGTVALFTGTSSIGNSAITQSGSNVTFSGGINPTKTAKNTYAIQIRGALYGAPRLQVYDLAADPNGYMGLGTDMSGAPYEFSNYFPRTGGNGKWSVGSWAGDFGTGQYVSGYNEKLFIVESAAQFNVALTLTAAANRINSGNELRFYRTDNAIFTQLYDGGNANGFVLDNRNGEGFSFQSAGTNQLRIANTGAATFSNNVGIGVAPATNLHVQGASVSYGQLRFLNTSSSGETSINIGRTNQTLEQRWTIGQGVAGIGDSFGFYTGGSSRVNLQTNGNVVIGTTSDNGARLQVSGTVSINGGINTYHVVSIKSSNALTYGGLGVYSSSNDRFINMQHTGTEGFIETENAGSGVMTPLSFKTGGTTRLTIASTGAATFSSSVTATSFFESSDATLKTLIADNYQAKGIDSVVAKLYIKNGKEELGYFAQDLQDVLPSAVSKGSDGLLNLSYREVHTAKIAYLEERIKQLEKKYENN